MRWYGTAVIVLSVNERGGRVQGRKVNRRGGRRWHNGGMTIRVFLLDDHELVREGIRLLLESDDGIEVVGEAATATEAMERIPLAKPDVAILDVRLEGGSGIEVCRGRAVDDARSGLLDAHQLRRR